MAIQSEQKLLHYRLVDKIGEGGMGVVWKAVDTTLDREVAIKVLPDAFAEDPDRLARFEREAKLLASLNHHNIASIFGVHESDDTRFLAMELVPGEDLAQRLRRGRLPVDEAIKIARQIAEALNPVWSPDGNLIVYAGTQVNVVSPLLAVHPDGDPVELPEIVVFRAGERMRFLPDGSGLVYMQSFGPSQDFWLLDLATMKSRQLTRLDSTATMRTFDITPDGERIVFDRLSEDSDIVLIDLKGGPAAE